MKKAPNIWQLDRLLASANSNWHKAQNGSIVHWVPARPIGLFSLCHRLRCAWLVFTGKADIVIWADNQ